MLETPEERIRLLKAGVDGKTIEELYLKYNDITIVRGPILFEPGGITSKRKGNQHPLKEIMGKPLCFLKSLKMAVCERE